MITTTGSAEGVELGVNEGTTAELLGVRLGDVLCDGLDDTLREGAIDGLGDGLGDGRLNLCHTLVVPALHTFLTLTIALYTTPIILFNLV